jgi:hypothetical protein
MIHESIAGMKSLRVTLNTQLLKDIVRELSAYSSRVLSHLGLAANNKNTDIKTPISNGLDERVQKSLDTIRVVGNKAVHPAEIDFNEDTSIAENIFELLNYIANELITKPKKADLLFDKLVPDEPR